MYNDSYMRLIISLLYSLKIDIVDNLIINFNRICPTA